MLGLMTVAQGMRRSPAGLVLACLAFALSASPGVAAQAAYVPKPGSPERKAVADAMRAKGDIHDRVFVTRYLMVQDGWAWMVADPKSRDGKNSYEPESALLRKEGKAWKVVDQPCGEGDCDADKELARIRNAFPAAPPQIFPK
jgi:hypothetical protein